ncbi:MAG: hypothetical protein ACOX9R_06500 [Armatimonadota bacterium]
MPRRPVARLARRPIAGLPIGAAGLVVLLAVVAAVGWSNTLAGFRVIGWHQNMMNGVAPAPDQYRVLTPMLAEALLTATEPATVEDALKGLQRAYITVHLLAFTVAGFFFLAFCRHWLPLPHSLLCVALLLGVAAVANLLGQIQVTDPMHLMFVTIGLWAIRRRMLWVLLAATIVGAVNRESILVLMGYYVLMDWHRSKRSVLLIAALLTVAWGATYGGLRLGYGMRAYSVDVVMLEYNLESVWRWAPPLLLLGPLMLAALQREVGDWPGSLRRATLVIPPYLLLHLTIARVEEVRLFLPLLPILIPLAVLGVAQHDAAAGQEDAPPKRGRP